MEWQWFLALVLTVVGAIIVTDARSRRRNKKSLAETRDAIRDLRKEQKDRVDSLAKEMTRRVSEFEYRLDWIADPVKRLALLQGVPVNAPMTTEEVEIWRKTPREIGMTDLAEQQFFARCAEMVYQGRGEIVDLGCWMGSTTLQLLRGLSANKSAAARARKVQAYDRFLWEEYMAGLVQAFDWPISRDLKPGDSFRPELEKRLGDELHRVNVHTADLQKEKWSGDPIEILLVDAMKNWDLTNNILAQFYPSLIPEVSLVIHQDFKFHLTYWIHLTHFRLRNYFRLFQNVRNAQTVAFQCIREIPGELLRQRYSLESFTRDEICEAMDYCHIISRGDEAFACNVLAAKVNVLLDVGDIEDARKAFDSHPGFGYRVVHELATVQARLEEAERKAGG